MKKIRLMQYNLLCWLSKKFYAIVLVNMEYCQEWLDRAAANYYLEN